MFLKGLQQGLNFANLPLLGSCTYSPSYCTEALNARVKYVAHRALVSQVLVSGFNFLSCSTRNLTLAALVFYLQQKLMFLPF